MKYLYPQGKEKALTFSYDDGQKFDRKLVDILNRNGLRGTFHLNSGHLADNEQDLFISRAEVPALYAGHEVACHGVEHRHLTLFSQPEMVMEVEEDRKELERLTGGLVQGMSYAYGVYSPEVKQVIKSIGIKYSRTVKATGYFGVPDDFLEWHPTCHHNGNLMETGERFLNAAGYEELPLMYVWGHSFEFDQNKNWELMEEFAAKMAHREEIWYATNIEICNYVSAVRRLEYSADGKKVHNPSALSVWMRGKDAILEVKPGETRDVI